jgi:hypothetical protein
MAVPTFQPRRDADLLTWSINFRAKIVATPETFGLDADQAARYADLHDAFAAAYATVHDPNTNCKQAYITKNEAIEALLYADGGAWPLVRIIQAHPDTTDAMRGELGLRIPERTRSEAPQPHTPPQLSIVATNARRVTVRLRDPDHPDRRGKPRGMQGATVLYHVGDDAATDPARWNFAMMSSKTVFDVEVPASVPAGSRLWLTAFWFNARKHVSTPATPRSTRIIDGVAKAA